MKQLLIIIVTFVYVGCSSIEKKDEKTLTENSFNKTNNLAVQDSLVYLRNLSLTGDFNGDGVLDTIYQNVINKTTRQPIHYFPNSQWDSIEIYFDKMNADVILTIKNQAYDTLHLGLGGGLYCLINIGDNNNDNKDEIAFVVDYYNFSNISPCYIYTLCNNKWQKLKSFKIHESAFDYEGEQITDFKQIKGFLEYRSNKWFYIDYQDWFDAETDKDTVLRPLKIETSCE